MRSLGTGWRALASVAAGARGETRARPRLGKSLPGRVSAHVNNGQVSHLDMDASSDFGLTVMRAVLGRNGAVIDICVCLMRGTR
jgi:hypothetical protein